MKWLIVKKGWNLLRGIESGIAFTKQKYQESFSNTFYGLKAYGKNKENVQN